MKGKFFLCRARVSIILSLAMLIFSKAAYSVTITSISPSSQYIEGTVTISGSDFSSSGNKVTFNSNVQATITNESTTSIVCTVPEGAVDGAITVTNATSQTSNGYSFTVKRPILTSITPNSGNVSGTVVLAGNGFSNTPNKNIVSFTSATGTANASITQASTASLTVTIPSTAVSGPVYVTANGLSTSSLAFAVSGTATISSVSPSSAAQGETLSVTLTGSNTNWGSGSTVSFLKSSTVDSSITVGSPTVNSSTSISVSITVDSSATTGKRDVKVKTGSGSVTLIDGFEVTGGSTSLPTLSQWGSIILVVSAVTLFFIKLSKEQSIF